MDISAAQGTPGPLSQSPFSAPPKFRLPATAIRVSPVFAYRHTRGYYAPLGVAAHPLSRGECAWAHTHTGEFADEVSTVLCE